MSTIARAKQNNRVMKSNKRKHRENNVSLNVEIVENDEVHNQVRILDGDECVKEIEVETIDNGDYIINSSTNGEENARFNVIEEDCELQIDESKEEESSDQLGHATQDDLGLGDENEAEIDSHVEQDANDAEGDWKPEGEIRKRRRNTKKMKIENAKKAKIKASKRKKNDSEEGIIIRNDPNGCGKFFECELCHKTFNLKSSLKFHLQLHTGEKPHECEICFKTFRRTYTLTCHMKVHTGEKPYECDICHETFSRKYGLDCHRKIHTGERPYECDVCFAAFRDKSTMVAHKRTHNQEKPYQCDICFKSFGQRQNVITHRRIHTGERPFLCRICSATFVQKCALKAHTILHTGERPFQCDLCPKNYASRGMLWKHKRNAH